MERTPGHALIIIDTALIIIVVLLPIFLVPRLRVILLDTVNGAVTEMCDGTLSDSSQLGKNKPTPSRRSDPRCKAETDEEKRDPPAHCFTNDKTPIQSKRHTEIEEPADDKITTPQAGTTLPCDDCEEPKNLINATLNRITADRNTAYPANDPISSVAINAPQGGPDTKPPTFTHPGIQYQFPLGAEKKSYPYFDVQVMRNFEIDFVGEETQDGVKAYKHSMTIPPQNLYESLTEHFTRDGRKLTEADKSSLTSMRLSFPAHRQGLEGDDDVEPDRYYINVRTARAEPTSGVIVNGAGEMSMCYAKDDEEAEEIVSKAGHEKEAKKQNRTAMKYTAQWGEDSKGRQMDRAKEARKSLTIGGTITPQVPDILGLVLIVIGFRVRSKSA